MTLQAVIMPTPRKHADHAARQRAYVERQRAAGLVTLAGKNMPGASPVPTMPSTARWRALNRQALEILQTMQNEMEEYRDERSEQWQDGQKGQAFEELLERVTETLQSAQNIEPWQ